MPRTLLAFGLAAALVAPAFAQEPATKPAVNAEDKDALNTYFGEKFRALMPTIQPLLTAEKADAKALDEAEAKLKALLAEAESLNPTANDAKALVQSIKLTLKSFDDQIDLARVTMDELTAKLKANPDDVDALTKYGRKATSSISSKVRSDSAAAEQTLASTKAFLAEVAGAAKQAAAKDQADKILKGFANIEKSLAAQKAQDEVIGKAAAPLAVETWVNGSPLTDADLKGKVVLLDFWAVWCGPCIATFPHLREWNEKYADKGLVMIGLTKYYNYNWDGDKAVRAQGKVEPADEQAMLGKFAGQHKLSHRFGVQAGNEMSEFYGVTGIPHVVVIDREGKVRMMKVGSGEANAKAIGDLLEKLLAEPVTGGE